MTSASSANATALPSDRRSLLTGAALASLFAATASVPVFAAEQVGPIVAAYAIWHRAARAADVACEATWEVEERFEEPERPRYHPFDSEGAHDIKFVRVDDEGRKRYRMLLRVDDENVADLKSMIAEPFNPSLHEPENVDWARESHERRIERAKATLAKIEAWQAEYKVHANACGLTAAQEHERPLMAEMRRLQDELLGMSPTSFREAAFQAAVFRVDWDEEAVDRLVKNLAALADIPAYQAAEV